MNLSLNKISKIKNKIDMGGNKWIIRVNVSEDRNISPQEICSNIYCIDKKYEIIWQVKDTRTADPFPNDMFIYVEKNECKEIIAYCFSGFIYKIDPDTGEAERIGFTK